MPAPYPLQMELHADRHITRWRPLVQWLLAIPHLMIAYALRFLRQILTLISFFAVLFTEQIPRQLFDAIVMTYCYEWRAMSYAFFMHEDYPPFDFALSSDDDGAEPHTSLRLTYPEHLQRWQPMVRGDSPCHLAAEPEHDDMVAQAGTRHRPPPPATVRLRP